MDADQDRITRCLNNRNFEGVEDFSHAKIGRPKVPTKVYRRELMKRDFETARRACNKQAGTIQSLLADNSRIAELQKERGKKKKLAWMIWKAPPAICDILEIEDEQIEQNSRYDAINKNNRETLRLLNENFAALQLKKDDCSSIYSGKSKRPGPPDAQNNRLYHPVCRLKGGPRWLLKKHGWRPS